jgi:hypothetical protein
MTVWPAAPLGPFVVISHGFTLGEGGTLEATDRRKWLEPRELPDEWVFRQLADANLDDDATVVSLLNEYGSLSVTGPSIWYWPEWIADDETRGRLEGEREADWWLKAARAPTVEDARWWLKGARALGGSWARLSLGEDLAEAWLSEGFAETVGYWEDLVPSLSGYWEYFQAYMNQGLGAFSPRVETIPEMLIRADEDEPPSRPLETDLCSAACAQVFNLMLEGHTARRCANETCGRIFVHQQGGSRFGQYRNVGVQYCKPACGRAQASRQYRRRKAAKTKEDT